MNINERSRSAGSLESVCPPWKTIGPADHVRDIKERLVRKSRRSRHRAGAFLRDFPDGALYAIPGGRLSRLYTAIGSSCFIMQIATVPQNRRCLSTAREGPIINPPRIVVASLLSPGRGAERWRIGKNPARDARSAISPPFSARRPCATLSLSLSRVSAPNRYLDNLTLGGGPRKDTPVSLGNTARPRILNIHGFD